MKTFFFSAFFMLWLSAGAQQAPQNLPRDVRIKVAVMTVPEEKRAGATVYGYSTNGEFVMLSEGNNDFICLAPDNRQDGSTLQAYAYPKSLDPFMARGRELIAQRETR